MSQSFGGSNWGSGNISRQTTKWGDHSEDPFDTQKDMLDKEMQQRKQQQDDIAALLGMNPAAQKLVPSMNFNNSNSQFLASSRRGLFERATFAAGCSYLTGLALGGTRGFFVGLRQAPNRRLRIRLNSVLNACGRGAKLGNSLGILAMSFTFIEGGYEATDLEKHVGLAGNDWVNSLAAAATTGVFYRSTAGIPVALASGVVGLAAGAAFFIGLPWLREEYGDSLPLIRHLHM